MSDIANKRALLVAAQALVHASNPDMPEFEAVMSALAQIFVDVTGVSCAVTLRVSSKQVHAALAAHDAIEAARNKP